MEHSNRLHVSHYSAQTEVLMTVKLHHDVAKGPTHAVVSLKSLGLELHDCVQTPISLMYIFYKVGGFCRSGHN